MALSYHEYTDGGTGTNGLGQNTFSIPFKYISINDVRVRGYNGSTWSDDLTITSDATAKTVTLTGNDPTTAGYAKVRLYRVTTTQALIDFQNGSRLSESDLDTAYQQSLFCAQEVSEAASGLGQPLQGNAGPQGPAGPTGATGPQGPAGPAGSDATGVVKKVSNILIEPIDLNTTNISDRIPADNTLPQITEGLRVKQVTYTPAVTSSTIHIDAYFTIGEPVNASNQFTSALFINDTCVNVMRYNGAGNSSSLHRLQAIYTNTTGASLDIEIRADGYRTIINGKTLGGSSGSLQTSASSSFGGSNSVNGSYMNITEY